MIARVPADRAQWRAELSRAAGRSESRPWREAALLWEGLGFPHGAAYCWWRCAEASLAEREGRPTIVQAIQKGYRLAAGHVPLQAVIDALARQAHVQVVPPPTASPQGAEVAPSLPVHLTPQEQTVLRLVSAGLTNAQIGAELFISPKTVSVHVSNVLRKFEVTDRVQAASWAEQVGLVSHSEWEGAAHHR